MYDHRLEIILAAKDATGKVFQTIGGRMNTLKNMVFSLHGAFITLAGGYGFKKVLESLWNVGLYAERMGKGLAAATGSLEEARKAETFLRAESERLGLVFQDQIKNYQKIAAAAKGTSLEGAWLKEIYLGIVEASTALQLSQDETSGALYAVSQMISKGKVQAEELRGQLGERLPGAFQIAADAMGVTTQELNRMLERGEIIADEFLPRFALALRKRFAGEVAAAADTTQANLNRIKNTWFDIEKTVMESGITTALGDVLENINDEMSEWLTNNEALIRQMPTYIGYIKEIVELILKLTKALGGASPIGQLWKLMNIWRGLSGATEGQPIVRGKIPSRPAPSPALSTGPAFDRSTLSSGIGEGLAIWYDEYYRPLKEYDERRKKEHKEYMEKRRQILQSNLAEEKQFTADKLAAYAQLYDTLRNFGIDDYEFRKSLIDKEADELRAALQGEKDAEELVNEWRKAEMRKLFEERWTKEHTLMDTMREGWGLTWAEIRAGGVNAWEDIGQAMTSVTQQAGGAFTDWILGIKDAKEAAKELSENILRSAVNTMIKLGIQRLILSNIQKTSTINEAVTTAASMAIIGQIAKEAAIQVSIATSGGAAYAGMAAYTTSVATMQSVANSMNFMNYTPMARGGVITRPTFVLAGEEGPEAILPLASTRRPEAYSVMNQAARYMDDGRRPAGGGFVGGGIQTISQPVTININALDARSFVELARDNPEAIVGPFRDELQGGNKSLLNDIKRTAR